jgi:hypothetical protein
MLLSLQYTDYIRVIYIMNLIEPIVQGYMFNEIMNHTEDTPIKKGGLPINKLIQTMQFISQKGGGAVRETPHFDKLNNHGIPPGLVCQYSKKDPTIQVAGEFNELDARVIPDNMFDSLVDLVTPGSKNQKTRKSNVYGGKRKTIKA